MPLSTSELALRELAALRNNGSYDHLELINYGGRRVFLPSIISRYSGEMGEVEHEITV